MDGNIVAFFDANVLYNACLRDILMELTVRGVIRGHWSDDVHGEWLEAIVRSRPDVSAAALTRTQQAMDSAVPDGLVTGYEHLIDQLNLPDDNDRHVLAAAIIVEADYIITFNTRDFPGEALAAHGVSTATPGDFLKSILTINDEATLSAVKAVRTRLRRPPHSPEDYLALLRRHQAGGFADELAKFPEAI